MIEWDIAGGRPLEPCPSETFRAPYEKITKDSLRKLVKRGKHQAAHGAPIKGLSREELLDRYWYILEDISDYFFRTYKDIVDYEDIWSEALTGFYEFTDIFFSEGIGSRPPSQFLESKVFYRVYNFCTTESKESVIRTEDNGVFIDFWVWNKELREKLYDILNTISEVEKNVIELRFGLIDGVEHTLEETGELLGIDTRERVRALEAKALRDLRAPSRSRQVKDFLD